MNKQFEMEQLLREIAAFYKSIPDMDHHQISNYINCNNRDQKLVNIHGRFYKKKKNYAKNGIRVTPYPDFFAIDIPDKNGKFPNLFTLGDGFKIYIPLEENKIYDISSKVIDYIEKNKIPSQYKIRNNYAYDAVSIRFANKEDTELVANYINNKLRKNIKDTLNPFIPQKESINICIDGEISYNRVLAKLIDRYMREKRRSKTLDKVSINDFYNFVNNEISLLEVQERNYSFFLYGLNNKRKYQDFIIVSKIIRNNIINNVSPNELEMFRKQKKISPSEKYEYTYEEQEQIKKYALREILNILIEGYDSNSNIKNSIDYLHKVIMDYISNGDPKYFTERRGVRKIIKENFSKEELREYILKLGSDALIMACADTKTKYGEEQLRHALKEAKENGTISGFTNSNGNRSELGIVMPRELFNELISNYNERKEYEEQEHYYYEEKSKIKGGRN